MRNAVHCACCLSLNGLSTDTKTARHYSRLSPHPPLPQSPQILPLSGQSV